MNSALRSTLVLLGLLAAALLWSTRPTPAAQAQTPAPVGDVAAGLVVYQQRCANCHGLLGLGDGEMAGQALRPPTALGTAAYTRTAIPQAMVAAIRNGNLEAGMPPFGEQSSNPLTEQQMWDLVGAIYALGTTSAEVRAGRALYEPDRFAGIDWTTTSDAAVAQRLTDAGFTAEATELSRLVSFARMSQFRYLLGEGVVQGSVRNGTADVAVGAGTVTLEAFEGFAAVETLTAELTADGSFRFTIPDAAADWIVRVSVSHQGIPYGGSLFQFAADGSAPPQAINVYDATADRSAITLNQLHMVVEPSDDGNLLVSQFYAYSNNGNTTYVGQIAYRVPENAANVGFLAMNSMTQFSPATTIISADGVGEYVDTAPFRPGSSGILVRYSVPYNGAFTLRQRLAWQPTAVTLIAPEGLAVQGGDWIRGATDQFDGVSYVNYQGALTGDTLELALSGAATPARAAGRDSQRELLVGSLALAATILGCTYVVAQWQKQTPPDSAPLLEAIANLDDAYEARAIPKALYEQRRKKLLQQLRDVWTYEARR